MLPGRWRLERCLGGEHEPSGNRIVLGPRKGPFLGSRGMGGKTLRRGGFVQ